MSNLPDLAETDKFLSKVDEIGSLIKDLANADGSNLEDAKSKADDYLRKFGVDEGRVVKQNKNVINSRPEVTEGVTQQPVTDKDAFMLMMEQDAKERYERRKRDEKLAMAQKELGNDEFKRGNYEKAVEYYSEGLKLFRDTTVLWTNRAQAYNKLGEYDKALIDCDWATRVFENCLKAYIHQGKAYLGLKHFDQAIESYQRAIQIEPKKKLMIENYIKEVELARVTEEQEQRAREKQSFGDVATKGIEAVLEKFNKEGQLPMYYSGGMRIISEELRGTEESRTLFRLNGGMKIIESHFLVSRCFNASPRSLSRDEIDLCEATIETMKCACLANEENQMQFLELADILNKLARFLESKVKSAKVLKIRIAELLLLITENDLTRRKLISHPDISRMLSLLFSQMSTKGVGLIIVSVINNLALTNKFKSMMREKLDEMLPVFEGLMTKDDPKLSVLPQCISTVTNLCAEQHLQALIVARKELWDACVTVLDKLTPKCSESDPAKVLFSVLGLLINVSQKISEQLDMHTLPLLTACKQLMTCNDVDIQERTFVVTSLILQHSKAADNFYCNQTIIHRSIDELNSDSDSKKKSAVKILAICTQDDEEARKEVIQHPQGLKLLLQQLKHSDEAVIGNTALCLGHCAVSSKAFCKKLTSTNIIMDLLVLARDTRKPTAQHNCAILIAKLCQGDQRHLEKLRELHGLEILHDVLKNVKE